MRTRTPPRRRHRPIGPVVATAAVTTALLVSCAAGGGEPDVEVLRGEAEHVPVSLAQATALEAVLAASDELGLAMLASATDANGVVSPVSLTVALSMLAEGARGTTAEELDRALGAAGAERTDTVSALRAALLEHDGDPAAAAGDELPDTPLLHLATRALLDDQLVPEQDYLDALSRGYDATLETLDLADPAAKGTLDEWVRRETGGLIEESAIVPTDDLRLVLQDAIVFAARWDTPFAEHATYPGTFRAPVGEVEVDLMHGSGWWSVTEIDDWTVVRMPYVESFGADLLLPPEGVDPADLPIEVLTAVRTGEGGTVLAGPGDRVDVTVVVPVLDLAPEPLDLRPVLEEVGLGGLFGTPDLSGVTTSEPLLLTQAFQQASFRLDEEGTVAAAVTELGVEAGSAPAHEPIEVRFDRPFLVRVAEDSTGATLFLAAVRDPSA